MSYYNPHQSPIGAPPPQGYPPQGYPPQGYLYPPPPQPGYPPPGYPPPYTPQYAQTTPQKQNNSGFMTGCLAALCCCFALDVCF